MGSGKSTLGKVLAESMNYSFADTDQLIEEREKKSVDEIFDQQGEAYFRQCEKEVLALTIEMENCVISTGGGLPCQAGNMDSMLTYGVTVYLEWPVIPLLENVIQLENRPLLADANLITIRNLLQQRIPEYEKASITLNCSGDLEVDIKAIQKLGRYLG